MEVAVKMWVFAGVCGWRWLFRCESLRECMDGDGYLDVGVYRRVWMEMAI